MNESKNMMPLMIIETLKSKGSTFILKLSMNLKVTKEEYTK
jgi:hypothetical protein